MNVRKLATVLLLTFSFLGIGAMLNRSAAGSDDLVKLRSQLLEQIVHDQFGVKNTHDATSILKNQRADGSWPDVDYASTQRSNWATAAHLSNILALAKQNYLARKNGKSDDAALAGIRKALAFWFEKDFKNSNWWWNEIGAPTTIGNTFILLQGDADPAQTKRACEILKRSKWTTWTGQNLVWGINIQIMRGCLEDSEALVREAFERFYKEIQVQPGEGIMADWSFHQHGSVLYAGGYGQGFSVDSARLVCAARGTSFEAAPKTVELLSHYMLDGQQWMIRGGYWDFGVVGREFTRKGKNAKGLATPAAQMAQLGTARAAEFKAFSARLDGENAAPLSGNRMFWRSDFMAHQRPAFYASARMFSTRIDNTDWLTNDENKRSHFIADGAFCLMQNGGEYSDIYPVWDWQKIPGITCEQREAMPDPAKVRSKGETAFAGGVSDGSCGVAAFDFKRDGLAARKAWFFFDDSVVCLGAGIRCSSDLPVATCLNQCRLNGAVRTSNGKLDWVWHDGVGYAMLGGAPDLQLSKGAQKGQWSLIGTGSSDEISLPVFKLWIDHGARPAAAEYQYAVAPGLDEAGFQAWFARKPVEVLKNSAELQSVSHKESGVVGMVFYKAGRLEFDGTAIEADHPCAILWTKKNDALRIAVANPECKEAIVELQIGLELKGEGAESKGARLSRVVFDLPKGQEGMEAGSSVIKNFTLAH